jgi:hypothetical protein
MVSGKNILSFSSGFIHVHLVLIFLIMEVSCEAQTRSDGVSVSGARSASLGYAAACVNDVWSVHNNPALMPDVSQITCGLYYENRFLLKELGYRCGVFLAPTSLGAIGGYISNFGYSAYSEWEIGLAYAREFGHYFSSGIQLDYYSILQGEDYGSQHMITFGIGLKTILNKKTIIVVHIYNPLPVKLFPQMAQNSSVLFSMGLIYHPSGNIMITTQADKDLVSKLSLKTGIEYGITDILILRAGLCTNPRIYTFGAGLMWRTFVFDLATSVHPQLGIYPQASVQLNFR